LAGPGIGSDALGEEIDNGGTGRKEVTIKPGKGLPKPQWQSFPENYPVSASQIIKLPKDIPKKLPKLQASFKDESSSDQQERLQQLGSVRAAFQHAWSGYKKVAMRHDEVGPLSETIHDPFNGWGATLVDSLDTLWIMDMKDEFTEAVDAVKRIDFTRSPRDDIPVFETVIRYLGGLLGAYDISGQHYEILLDKAKELAEVLIGAFDTPNRMPVLYYRWAPEHVSRRHRANAHAVLAEIGSLSLEFTRLAQLTREDRYYDAIARITNELEKIQDSTTIPGLWPQHLNAQGCANYKTSTSSSNVGSALSQSNDRSSSSQSKSNSNSGSSSSGSGNVGSSSNSGSSNSGSDLGSSNSGSSYSGSSNSGSNVGSGNPGSLYSRDVVIEDAERAVGANALTDPKVDTTGATSQTQPSEGDCKDGLLMPQTTRDNSYGLGGAYDSTYEYLPKEFLLLGGVNVQYEKMYKKAMGAARNHLLFKPMVKDGRDLRFFASTIGLDPTKKATPRSTDLVYEGSHLSCFAGGMMALGAKAFDIQGDLDLAGKLTDGCVWAYESTKTGIMPEQFRLLPCEKDVACTWDESRFQSGVQKWGTTQDSHAQAQFRSAESEYGQRVKLNEESGAERTGEGGMAVPMPMPGSVNPHDDHVYKRDVFATGRQNPSESHDIDPSLDDRDTLRDTSRDKIPDSSRNPQVISSQAQVENDRRPAGMLRISSPQYFLRPEAIESVFIMYRTTGDDYWRRKGWKMFEAIQRYTRTDLANAAINDVTSGEPVLKDTMESFWLAETLKYFYLLFSDPSVVDLDQYVL
jgi:mannosyl-oligosaccharide alpha-1,2-mannosidase